MRLTLTLFLFLFTALPCTVFAQAYDIKIRSETLSTIQNESLLKNLSLHRQRQSPYLTADYVERLFEKGKSELQVGLKVFGFYKASVTGEIFKEEEDTWTINYTVDTGPALNIKSIHIDIQGDGKRDDEITNWRADFPLKTGDALNQQVYEKAKNTLQQILRERGYFDGKLLKHELRISLSEYFSEIILHIDTGQRYQFGRVTFIQSKFSDRYLQGFVSFAPGDIFDSTMLTQLQKDLSISGEFQTIEITPQVDLASNYQVPVRVNVTPRKPKRYKFGLGYGTDTGARVRGGIERRQITDTGHRADGEAFISQVRQEFSTNYYIPLEKPATDYLNFNAAQTEEQTDELFQRTNSVSISTVYALKDWQRTIKVTYLDEDYKIGDTTQDKKERSELLIPSLGFRYLPPKQGMLNIMQWRGTIEVKGAHEAVASDTSFLQARLVVNNRWPLFSKLALVSRGDVGWSWVDEFSVLPPSQRFFAGGDNSIRGYAYKSLGPEDEDGDVEGGNRLLVGSVELQYNFKPDWDFAVFTDAGNAFNDADFEFKQGAGLGFGWQLPFGAIRVYAASALSNHGAPWRMHITVGAQW